MLFHGIGGRMDITLLLVFIDICVVFFDLLIFTRMISLKQDSFSQKFIMYLGCTVILAGYFVTTYLYQVPSSIASMLCMTVPSMLLFWYLSAYKDARFFLTFCFVDTISMILAFLARYVGVLFGGQNGTAEVVVLAGLLLLCAAIFKLGSPYFGRYRELLVYADAGWGAMAISAAIIYIALIFFAAYPKPLITRVEYGPQYLLFCIVVISCYGVFITSARKTRQLFQQSKLLEVADKWYEKAYVDALTGCKNRMAYMEKQSELERMRTRGMMIAVVVFDLDHFKNINDLFGHNIGDVVLKKAAELLHETFCGKRFFLYRIGGDEFVALCEGADEELLKAKLQELEERRKKSDSPAEIMFSCGYSFVNAEENNAVEQAFVRADQIMYENKRENQNR